MVKRGVTYFMTLELVSLSFRARTETGDATELTKWCKSRIR